LQIGELSRRTGLPVSTLRFYEIEGLIHSDRTASNYRIFSEATVEQMQRIKHFRALNLSLPEMKLMLEWSLTPSERCGEVCQLIERQLEHLLEQKAMLCELETEMRRLLSICSGRGENGCNILRELS
jgi:DNA-binding transcriptional MerR regulator